MVKPNAALENGFTGFFIYLSPNQTNMTLNNFIKKLNWRLILMHFAGSWCFVQAFPILAHLYNTGMFTALQKMLYHGGADVNNYLAGKKFTLEDVVTYAVWADATWLLGLLTAFAISLTISIQHKWFWVNSVIVLVVLFCLQRFYLAGWVYLKHIFLEPGNVFKSPLLYLLTNGLILLVLGIFMFYYKRFQRFIEHDYTVV